MDLELAQVLVLDEGPPCLTGSRQTALVARAQSSPIYLTTLASTIPFYARAGFQQVPLSQAPR